jgi:hypothetical protein
MAFLPILYRRVEPVILHLDFFHTKSARYGKLQICCIGMTREGITVNEEEGFVAYLRCSLVGRCRVVGDCGC